MIVVDFDDICLNDGPSANGMHWMYFLKGKYPKFKVNLFAIPGRSNWQWLSMIAKHDWISLCMHGWTHDENEVITEDMLRDWPYTKVYKGPNWKVLPSEVELLDKNDFILATKDLLPGHNRIVQWPLTDIRAVHGHVWVEADWIRLAERLQTDSDCRFIWQVVL